MFPALPRRHRVMSLSAAGHLAVHAVVFLGLTWWSWRKWPDPLIDFGRELYVPWQITEGRVLYRDIASLFGPLSPYVNAAFFQLFGVSLTTVVFGNLAILALMIAGIHYLVRTTCGLLVATIATISTLVVFGFGRYVLVGNYNFVCPYSHEATHGMALSVAVLVTAHMALVRRRLVLFGLAGVCFGLVLLTKPEVSLAAAAGVAVAMGTTMTMGRDDRATAIRGSAVFVLASLAGPLAFLSYFAMHMALPNAIAATAGAFASLRATELANGPFYRMVSGLDSPGANSIRMIGLFAGIVLFVIATVVVSRAAAGGSRVEKGRGVRRFMWLGALGALLLMVPWGALFPRALPVATAAAIAGFGVLFARGRAERDGGLRLVPALMWSVFALVLLAKMVLNTRIFHYGFYLALPATTVLIMLLTWLVPQGLERWYSVETGRVFRRISTWMLAAAFAPYLVLSYLSYARLVFPVGSGGDRFYTFDAPEAWEGPAVARASDTIDRLTTPRDSVAVLPEGVMLNYLSRRSSPLRVVNVMPPELLVFGEHDVLESLQKGRPELVLLLRREMTEYGYPPFGTDARYGGRIARWLDAHYEPVPDGSGPDQLTEPSKIRVLRRRVGH